MIPTDEKDYKLEGDLEIKITSLLRHTTREVSVLPSSLTAGKNSASPTVPHCLFPQRPRRLLPSQNPTDAWRAQFLLILKQPGTAPFTEYSNCFFILSLQLSSCYHRVRFYVSCLSLRFSLTMQRKPQSKLTLPRSRRWWVMSKNMVGVKTAC